MTAKTITWLHLSDLHTCKPRTGWDAYQVLDTLELDLKDMERAHGLRPDFIVFTGDAVFGHLGPSGGLSISEQFTDAEAFFTRVRNAFTVPVPKRHFFIVPGNHDVDRNMVTDEQTQWLGMQASQQPIIRMMQDANLQWQRNMERLGPYKQFLEREGYAHLLKDSKRLTFTDILEISGVTVGIAGLNSAWSCCRDREKGNLWLGGSWQLAELYREIKSTGLKIALMHHPLNWLVPQEDPKLWHIMERDFDFFLHGHEHQGWVHDSADGHVRIAAAACYDKGDDENGYNFVRINIEDRSGEVFLRRYDSLGGGWVDRLVYGKTQRDGRWPLNGLRLTASEAQICSSSNQQMASEIAAIELTFDQPISEFQVSQLSEALKNILGVDLADLEITRIWKGSTNIRLEGDSKIVSEIVSRLSEEKKRMKDFALKTKLTKFVSEFQGSRYTVEVTTADGEVEEPTSLDLSYQSLTEVPAHLENFVNVRQLNLSSNRLAALPNWLSNFAELEDLDISRNQFSDLPDWLGELRKLRRLVVRSNQLTTLPQSLSTVVQLQVLDLSGNDFSSVPEWLGELSHLQTLDLSRNRLPVVPISLGRLEEMRELFLAGNRLTSLPDSLQKLQKLEVLSVSGNELRSLPEWLGTFATLQSLSISTNQLNALPSSLRNLVRLRHLDLSANAFSELPVELETLPELQRLDLANNPLNPELAAAYAHGQEVVFRFLRARSSGSVVLNEAKLILVGEGEVGKSSLLAALRGEPWEEGRLTTHGIEIKPVRVTDPATGTEITLNGWDFGGQRVYRPTHQLFFSSPAVYLVVWKPREGPQQGFVKEWIKLVKHREPDAKILVVATHGGPKERQPDIDRQVIWDLFGKDTVIDFFHVESKPRKYNEKNNRWTETSGINELKDAIAKVAASLPEVGRSVPSRWQDVREALKQTGDAYLPLDRVFTICGEHGMSEDEAQYFVRISHRLGHLIHYGHDPRLRDMVILKPDWLTTAISFVLDDEETRQKHGLVEFTRLSKLWSDKERTLEFRYPAHVHPMFVALMERFDMSYRVAGSPLGGQSEETILVGQLVPDVRPEADIAREWPEQPQDGDEQQMQICRIVDEKGQSAPAEGLFYQLIVRLHKFSLGREDFNESIHWQRGLILDDDYNGRALLEHIGNDVRITVRAAYPGSLLAMLTHEVKWLVENFWEGLKCQIVVPCIEPCGKNLPGTAMFEVQRLIESKRRGLPEYPCGVCNEWQNIDNLLQNEPVARRPAIESVITEGLGDMRPKLDDLRQQNLALDHNLKRIMSQVEDAFRGVMQTMNDDGREGPRLFSLEPVERTALNPTGWVKKKFRVTLWCEHNRLPLPLLNEDDKEGVYEFDITREWFANAAPFLKVLTGVLRLVLPLSASATKWVINEDAYRNFAHQLDRGKECAESMFNQNLKTELIEEVAEHERLKVTPSYRGALHEFQTWLKKEDPTFGDLRKVLNKRHEFLWVHRDVENEY